MKILLICTILINSHVFAQSIDIDSSRFEGESFKATLQLFNKGINKSKLNYIFSDSIFVEGSIMDIALKIVPFHPNYIYSSNNLEGEKYELKVESNADKLIDQEELFNKFASLHSFEMDTISTSGYLLTVDKNLIKTKQKRKTVKFTFYSIVMLLRSRYNAPIVIEESQENFSFQLDMFALKFRTFDQFREYLENEQGFTIDTEATDYKVYFVTLLNSK